MDLVARAAEGFSNSALMAKGNSDLVARAAEENFKLNIMSTGTSDLVAGLEGILIWLAEQRRRKNQL